MSDIKVTFQALTDGATTITSTASSVNGHLEELATFLNQYVAEWTGDAREGYNEQKAKWDSAAARLNSLLATIGSAVADSSLSYQEMERINRSVWDGGGR